MSRKSVVLIGSVLLLCLVNGAIGAPPDIEFSVDFAYPNETDDPCDPNYNPDHAARYAATAKDGWWIWQAPAWSDMHFHHDGVWEDGSGLGPVPATDGIAGTGIHATVDVGYDGDTCLHIYGMQCVGSGMEPNGMPDPNTDPICNSEIVSPRHRGAGWKGNDGSILLTFYRLPRGTYTLKSYHNDLFLLEEVTSCQTFPPLDPRIMPAIIVTGDGTTQTQFAYNVEIQAEVNDVNLVPSEVSFETDGSAPVEVEYVTSPIGQQYTGASAVLNAFELQGWKAPQAFWPVPPSGATDVDPNVEVTWRAGAHAVSHDVYFGTDIDDVTNASDPNTLPGRGRQEPDSYDPPGFLELGQTYYWRIDEVNENHPNSPWRGDMWSFTVDDGKAHSPDPENGAMDVPLDANLGWSPGDYAASHDVYLGTDAYAVLWATDPNTPPGRGRQDPCSYDPCGLEFNKTYYWRIDEVNPGLDNSKGDLWFFTTTQCTIVDDMEFYDKAANYIYDTWSDGVMNWSGSLVDLGAPPDDPVHDGNHSMLFIYDTNDPLSFKYAEAEASIADLEIGPNWTVLGVKALILHFYGDPDNKATDTEQLYVGLEDSGGASSYGEVRYGDNGEDMNDLRREEWTAFNIELEDFNQLGVDLTAVEKIYIGFGDRVAQVPGGSGLVYFDNIRLCLPRRCLDSIAKSEGDINNDCIVDYRDARIMAADWLDIDLVEVQAPDPCGLLVEYTFDNNDYNDTSGNEYHGLPSFLASVSDGKLILAPDPNYEYERAYVTIPLGEANPFVGTGNYSIQMTLRSTDPNRQILLASAPSMGGGDDDHPMMVYTRKSEDWENWTPELHILATGGGHDESVVNFQDGMMHSIVLTYDALAGRVDYYTDGREDGSWPLRYWMPDIDQHYVRIGDSASVNQRNEMDADFFDGEIDSVRIYDYPLSQLEAMYLTTNGTGIRPIISPANLYNEEPPGSRVINIRDYAVLALNWLHESYWP